MAVPTHSLKQVRYTFLSVPFFPTLIFFCCCFCCFTDIRDKLSAARKRLKKTGTENSNQGQPAFKKMRENKKKNNLFLFLLEFRTYICTIVNFNAAPMKKYTLYLNSVRET